MQHKKDEVEAFLRNFNVKMDIWGIFYLDREKNAEALSALGITGRIRDDIVRSVSSEDYVETLFTQAFYGDMWVFGKDFEGTELYIKISLGAENSRTICISFHKAERPITYAWKHLNL